MVDLTTPENPLAPEPVTEPRYQLRAVLYQSPDKVKTAVMAVLGVGLALLTDVEPSLLETVGAGIALERLLDLFYAAPVKKAEETRTWKALEGESLKAIDLGLQLAAVQPPPPPRPRKAA